MDRIKELLGKDWVDLNAGMREYLKSDIDLLNSTNDNLLANSGKQIRPVLSLLIARACCGAVNGNTLRYALSTELLHNATLLHDDVADASDQRRGKPTLRSIMGPEVSVLVGDYWLVSALNAIMDCDCGRDECLKLFSRTLGNLAEGEMLQLQKAENADTTMEDYLRIIYSKTGSLFVSAAKSAAISVGASDAMLEAAQQFGMNLGYAFQIKDDILDYCGGQDMGKPLGVDIQEKKITLPLLGAFANAGREKEMQIREKVKNAAPFFKEDVVAFVEEYGGVDYAIAIMEEYVSKAKACLEAFPESEEKRMLGHLASYIAERNR